MKEETRRAVAFAVLARATGHSPNSIYSHSESRRVNMSGGARNFYDHEAGAHISGAGATLYHHGLGQHISLTMNGNSFSGYDYNSGCHFSGSTSGRSVQLYDHGEGRHFNYQG